MSAARRVTFLPGASAASSPSRPGSQLGSVHLADARAEEPRRRGSPLPGLFFPPELRRASNVLPPIHSCFRSNQRLRSEAYEPGGLCSAAPFCPLVFWALRVLLHLESKKKNKKKRWCKENQGETKRPRASGPRRTPRAARVRSSVRWDRDSAHPPCRRHAACRLVRGGRS